MASKFPCAEFGSGVWLIFAASYVVALPAAIYETTNLFATGILPGRALVVCIALVVGLIALIVFVEGAERRLPVEYADGRTNPMQFLSLKIDNTGVLAPLLAGAVLLVPTMIASLFEPSGAVWSSRAFAPLYLVAYAALIIFFAFYFTAAIIDSRQLVPGAWRGRR